MKKSQPVQPIGAAMDWVARIVVAGLIMVLPGLAGEWIDNRIGTGFVALIGFALGIAISLVYLLAITRKANRPQQIKNDSNDSHLEP